MQEIHKTNQQPEQLTPRDLVSAFAYRLLLWPGAVTDPDFTYLGDCQFELSGADGIVRSSQVEQEEKTKPGQAVDCIWTIKATPKAKEKKTLVKKKHLKNNSFCSEVR